MTVNLSPKRQHSWRNPQPPWLRWIFLIAIATGITRMVLQSQYGTTALFYVTVPFIIGLLIYLLVPPPAQATKAGRIGRHLRSTLVVLLASSIALFEGFLCVLFAAPIYIVFATLVMLMMPAPKPDHRGISDVFRVSAVPLLVAILSIEGLTPSTSFEREHSTTRTAVLDASIPQIKTKLAQPIELTETRSAFLNVFPLPTRVEAGSLEPGDVHTSHYTYKRWPIGNTHRGSMKTLIKEVGERHVVTEITGNDAYFSHYLTIHGTRIDMTPRDDGRTEVALTINYRRDLDPAWYFGWLQKRAVTESADYLIEQIITPDLG